MNKDRFALAVALLLLGGPIERFARDIDECTGTYTLTTHVNAAGETEVVVTLKGQKHTESSTARMSVADSTYQPPAGIKVTGTIMEVDTDIRKSAFSAVYRWLIPERYQCIRRSE